jgi:hypothetical protein
MRGTFPAAERTTDAASTAMAVSFMAPIVMRFRVAGQAGWAG